MCVCRGEGGGIAYSSANATSRRSKRRRRERKRGLVRGRWLTHSHLAPSDTHLRTRSLARSLSHSRAALFLTVVVVAVIFPLYLLLLIDIIITLLFSKVYSAVQCSAVPSVSVGPAQRYHEDEGYFVPKTVWAPFLGISRSW